MKKGEIEKLVKLYELISEHNKLHFDFQNRHPDETLTNCNIGQNKKSDW